MNEIETHVEILEELKECYRRLENTTREYKERIVRLEVRLADHEDYAEKIFIENTRNHEHMIELLSSIQEQILVARTFSRFLKATLLLTGTVLGFMISQWENIIRLFKHS